MKRNENPSSIMAALAKSIVAKLSRLFFKDSGKDFQRLKKYISS
jgi:hypothetical protein